MDEAKRLLLDQVLLVQASYAAESIARSGCASSDRRAATLERLSSACNSSRFNRVQRNADELSQWLWAHALSSSSSSSSSADAHAQPKPPLKDAEKEVSFSSTRSQPKTATDGKDAALESITNGTLQQYVPVDDGRGKLEVKVWRAAVTTVESARALAAMHENRLSDAVRCCDTAFIIGGPVELQEAAALIHEHGQLHLQPLPTAEKAEGVADDGDQSDADDTDYFALGCAERPQDAPECRHPPPVLNCDPADPGAFLGDGKLPMVVRGLQKGWTAGGRWPGAQGLLATAHRHRHVPVELGVWPSWREAVLPLGRFAREYLQQPLPEVPVEARASGAKARDAAISAGYRVGYLAQHALLEQIPALWADVAVPAAIAARGMRVAECNVWCGTAHTVTPTHYDDYDNFLCQVAGYKYVRVLAPTEAKHLYPYGEGDVIATTGRYVGQRNVSQVDNIEAPDVARFPLALEAEYVDVVLGPGDSLYMPSGWWHYVRSLTPSNSVNFWFEKDPDATAAAQ